MVFYYLAITLFASFLPLLEWLLFPKNFRSENYIFLTTLESLIIVPVRLFFLGKKSAHYGLIRDLDFLLRGVVGYGVLIIFLISSSGYGREKATTYGIIPDRTIIRDTRVIT